jgi:phosphate transport system permease protein
LVRTYEAGLKFDQRNSLIVGLVMGFAVIAPIFSISEDALFAVPRHITNGSWLWVQRNGKR